MNYYLLKSVKKNQYVIIVSENIWFLRSFKILDLLNFFSPRMFEKSVKQLFLSSFFYSNHDVILIKME